MSLCTRSSLKLSLDLPREVRPIVLAKDGIGDGGVGVFGIDQESVDVEDACADGWEATDLVSHEPESMGVEL